MFTVSGFQKSETFGVENNPHRPRWRHLVLSTPTGALSLAVPLVRGALVLVGYQFSWWGTSAAGAGAGPVLVI